MVDKWAQLYPNQPFPDPYTNPQVYPPNFVIKKTVYNYDISWWSALTGDCCSYSRCCDKGLIDYVCQYNNSCYLNLASFAFYIIGFILGILVFIVLFGLACRWIYKISISVVFIHKLAGCFASWMKCFTFGIFDEKVYYKNSMPKLELNER